MTTEVAGDVEIFQQLDFEPTVPCSFTDCDAEAVAMLVCPVCGAQETMCQPHTEAVRQIGAADEWAQITFDNTCHHKPFFCECKILPL